MTIKKAVKKATIHDLENGDFFRIVGKRKWRQFHYLSYIDPSRKVPPEHAGKYLIVLENCRQILISEETMIEIDPLPF